MKKRLPYLFILFTFLFSCTSPKKEQSKKENFSDAERLGRQYLAECLKAHGDLTIWNQFSLLSYKKMDHGIASYQTIDLRNRKTHHKTDTYQIGFDGENVWVYPNRAAFPNEGSVRFFYNIDFYFFATPFVMADSGTNAEFDGQKVVNGKTYDVIKITYERTVGFTPEDIYYLLIDSKTRQLKILLYTISFLDKSNTKLTAKVYEWQEYNGFLLPKKMENYAWENDNLGENKHHSREFSEIKLSKDIIDESIFIAPDGAFIEPEN